MIRDALRTVGAVGLFFGCIAGSVLFHLAIILGVCWAIVKLLQWMGVL